MTSRENAWYERLSSLDGSLYEVICRSGDEHPDGSTVISAESGVCASSAPVQWRTSRADPPALLTIEWGAGVVDGAPDLWFVSVPEPRSTPPATNLVAFTGSRFPSGTVVSNHVFAGLGVPNDEQAAAVRWYPESGIVHQIFVAPAWRRRQVGTALLYAASAFHQSNGWPAHLRSDGRRTDIGEMFVAGLRHPQRIAPRTDDMPSMD